ncbi:MAG: cyclic nucleotide-binding domain-containing protein [Candidatus Woesearchaeota archaeon]
MKALYDTLLFEKPDVRKLQNEINKTTIFKPLTASEMKTVSRHLQIRKFKKGERIFFEGDTGSALFIVLKGSVQISKTGRKKTIFAELGNGAFFGELALVHDVPRTASAVASEDTLLVCLFRHDYEQIIRHYPLLGNKLQGIISKIIAQRLASLIENTS